MRSRTRGRGGAKIARWSQAPSGLGVRLPARMRSVPALVATLATLLAPESAEAQPAGTCLTASRLPCVATAGETYGAVTLTSGNDRHAEVQAVLQHVLGATAQVGLVARDLTRDSSDFDFTPDTIDQGQSFQWLALMETGSSMSPAFLTVKAAQAFAVFPVFGMEGGGVDASGLLGGHDISHVSFWRAMSSQCVPVRPEKFHGKGMLPGTRLAQIENGWVPCVHVDTGERADCAFHRKSGSWVKTRHGDFAQVGQMVTLGGQPDGEYVIAAQVGGDASVACVEPSGRDSVGTAYGTELGISVTVETMLSPANASGLRLVNHATLEVCTSSSPHPDGALFTRMLDEKSHCYIGEGAGLNDINGWERDRHGVYLPGREHRHVVWSNGVEVPGAKRPATLSFPRRVKTDTPLVWRPVDNRIRIAN